MAVLGSIFIYVQIITLIHNSFYVSGNWGKNLSHKKRCNERKKMFTGRIKPIRIISDSNNQLPDEWSSVVLSSWKEIKLQRPVISYFT